MRERIRNPASPSPHRHARRATALALPSHRVVVVSCLAVQDDNTSARLALRTFMYYIDAADIFYEYAAVLADANCSSLSHNAERNARSCDMTKLCSALLFPNQKEDGRLARR